MILWKESANFKQILTEERNVEYVETHDTAELATSEDGNYPSKKYSAKWFSLNLRKTRCSRNSC